MAQGKAAAVTASVAGTATAAAATTTTETTTVSTTTTETTTVSTTTSATVTASTTVMPLTIPATSVSTTVMPLTIPATSVSTTVMPLTIPATSVSTTVMPLTIPATSVSTTVMPLTIPATSVSTTATPLTTAATSASTTSTTISGNPAATVAVVTVTAIQSVASPDDTAILGLALGLGIPFLLLTGALILYTCCGKPCAPCSSKVYRRIFKKRGTVDISSGSKETFVDENDDSQNIPTEYLDYRQKYIREGDGSEGNGPPLTENALASVSTSDLNLRHLNVTSIPRFSSSANSFPHENSSTGNESTTKLTKPTSNSSILVRAYTQQKAQQSILRPTQL